MVSCVKNPIIFSLLHRYSPVAHMCVCKTSAHLAARVEDNSMLYCCALRATRSLCILVNSLLLCQRPSIFGRLWTKKKHIDVPIVRFEKFGNRLIVWMRLIKDWISTKFRHFHNRSATFTRIKIIYPDRQEQRNRFGDGFKSKRINDSIIQGKYLFFARKKCLIRTNIWGVSLKSI